MMLTPGAAMSAVPLELLNAAVTFCESVAATPSAPGEAPGHILVLPEARLLPAPLGAALAWCSIDRNPRLRCGPGVGQPLARVSGPPFLPGYGPFPAPVVPLLRAPGRPGSGTGPGISSWFV